MVLDNLGNSLKEGLKKLTKGIFVDEGTINELVKDIQRALLRADVNVNLVFELSKEIKRRALEDKVPKGISQKEYIIKIVYDELVKFLGGDSKGVSVKKKPFKIMVVGLYGSGKSTSVGKLSRYYRNRGYRVCAVALDVHRPAAIDQLEQISKQVGVPCFFKKGEKNPVKIYKEFENEINKFDVVLIDTAGRDALSEELIKELTNLNVLIKPDEKLLVISADIGQAAQNQAEAFHKSVDVTGVFITKMDGTSKAGGALAAAAHTKAYVKFIGVGEKSEDLEMFNAQGFVSRLLGMGDLETLLEKTKEVISEEKAKNISDRFMKGDFNFLDLYEQLQAMRKMGSLKKVMGMIPGMGDMKIPEGMMDVQEDKLKKWKYVMASMTEEELKKPDLLNRSRVERISKGSGTTVSDVRDLLKQYKQSKKLVKMVGGRTEKGFGKLMKKFSGSMPKGFKGM